jgi:hypothetical protein
MACRRTFLGEVLEVNAFIIITRTGSIYEPDSRFGFRFCDGFYSHFIIGGSRVS